LATSTQGTLGGPNAWWHSLTLHSNSTQPKGFATGFHQRFCTGVPFGTGVRFRAGLRFRFGLGWFVLVRSW
jgi:hypothetical protein